jgi:F0F1-type ATP synthase epsilon subunit
MSAGLHVVVRTPREVVADAAVRSLRVPTATGQVGVRPRAEATVLAVEPGLVVARDGERSWFLGTAGGILRTAASEAVLLTPIAVRGDDPAAVVAALDAALASPDAEQDLRRAIGRLETGLLRELRGADGGGRR